MRHLIEFPGGGEPALSSQEVLSEERVPSDPLTLFVEWAQQAKEVVPMPELAFLATVDVRTGQPSVRAMLVKWVDERGFVFFTNYASRKAQELLANPRASLAFFWHPLYRQVRVEGFVERLSEQESDEYFASRPRERQLAAWASAQSRQVASRPALDQAYQREAERWQGVERIPRPPFWGGYRLVPITMEFWQGHLNRLHDRLLYVREGGEWRLYRLFP